jgi:UDP-2,3-diacylglucosamine pyrophosphatase LpxH
MKRRDFLKGMGTAAAMGTVGGDLGLMGSWMKPRSRRNAQRNKLVFISDIHLNVAANYSWMTQHIEPLADFLRELNSRADVAELIILGDLLDEWVAPTEVVPQDFAEVLATGVNAPVIGALQDISLNSDMQVTYVTGNHDLLSFEDANKAVIATTFPGMNIVSDYPGLGSYSKDQVLWAEHGHRYCLFNAPDIWSREGGHLPLGYFISRLAACKSAVTGEVITTPDILAEALKLPASRLNELLDRNGQFGRGRAQKGHLDDALVSAVFYAVAIWAGKGPLDQFLMDGLDGFRQDPMVMLIGHLYKDILSEWRDRQNIVIPATALVDDAGVLNGAANLLLRMPERIRHLYPFKPRIVLFGHTHRAELRRHPGFFNSIYANTGTWIDGKDMTWVEVEVEKSSRGGRIYTVSLWYYGESVARHSAVVRVAAG